MSEGYDLVLDGKFDEIHAVISKTVAKRNRKQKRTKTMKKLAREVLGTIALVGLAVFGVGNLRTSSAGNVSRSFEFGPGTTLSRSIVRTFPIPCHLEVAAVVKYRRDGGAAGTDVPILIELRRPDVGPDQEGEVFTNQIVTAKFEEQTAVLRASKQNRGCSLPWRVRIQHKNDGAAPLRVYGTIRLDFDDRLRDVPVTGGVTSLNKGQSTTKNIGGVEGFEHGVLELEDTWSHLIGGVIKGPFPVKLRYELIDPSGAVVKTASNQTNISLTYLLGSCVSGQWKVRITNIDPNNDASGITPYVQFTPACAN